MDLSVIIVIVVQSSRQTVSSNLRTLILDVKNTNSIQEAVNTVRRLLPPSAGIYLLDAFVCESVEMFYRLSGCSSGIVVKYRTRNSKVVTLMLNLEQFANILAYCVLG